MDPDDNLPIAGWLCVIAFLAFVFAALWNFQQNAVAKNGIETSAVVIGKDQRVTGRNYGWVKPAIEQYARVQFQDKSGQIRTVETKVKSGVVYDLLKPGERINVMYDRRDPKRVEIKQENFRR